MAETPPRTWRRPPFGARLRRLLRNTSTNVEKTSPPLRRDCGRRKHLHGRGEELVQGQHQACLLETPPRTWRRRSGISEITSGFGNTSTDVEKTWCAFCIASFWRKHLHGRGEDWNAHMISPFSSGNTSTDVEKTFASDNLDTLTEKHLHGRGEDFRGRRKDQVLRETPPRTWRRPQNVRSPSAAARNTSTDVEKTKRGLNKMRKPKKHLHGRGEDFKEFLCVVCLKETPPRTWRRLDTRHSFTKSFGNTSTDVEKTD